MLVEGQDLILTRFVLSFVCVFKYAMRIAFFSFLFLICFKFQNLIKN